MSDWSERPISALKIGDEVVGYKMATGRQKASLAKAVIEYAHREIGPLTKATLQSGRVVFCTPNHRWFADK